MKSLKMIGILSICLLAFIMSYAGDTYNVDGAGNGVPQFSMSESYDQVIVQFSPYMLSDSIGSFHSKPIYIGDMNNADCYIQAITNATSDMNILFHLSNNLQNWTAVTPAGLDQCSNSAKIDTLGCSDANSTMFHHNNYLIIEVDGQTGCNTTDRITLILNFKKDADVVTGSGAVVKLGKYLGRSVTNP